MNRSTKAHSRGVGLFVVAALLGVLANVAGPPRVAHAAAIQVNTYDDVVNSEGDCSLREAIQAANTNAVVDGCSAGQAAPNLDTITFAAATNGIPIVLIGAAGEDANASGDLDILDGGDLTIQGNGEAKTILDGSGWDRLFHVCPGGGCTATVTLRGMTIRNGDGGVQGGGIYHQAGTLTLEGSAVIGNEADFGGGIYSSDTLNVANGCAIGRAGAGNEAVVNGGGIFNSAGTVRLTNSSVSANEATNGAAIYNWEEGTLNVTGSSIGEEGASNKAVLKGGGIYNEYSATVTVVSSSIAYNWAGHGGGIYNKGTTTVDSSTFSNNSTEDGGGIYNHSVLDVLNGSIIGGTGAGNSAAGNGGGIYNGSGGTTTVDASIVSANTADYGGGIYSAVPSTAHSGRAGDGIRAQATLVVRNGSSIGEYGAGNEAAVVGGGIYNGTDGTTTMENSTVISNTAASSGGGISNWFGTIMVQGSTVISNTAVSSGGGINNYYGTMTVDGCRVSANTAAEGGGIYNHATLNVTNSTIGGAGAGNTATAGGGIRCWFGTTTLYGSTVSNNTAVVGGGIYNDAIDTATAVPGANSVPATLFIQNSTIGGAGAGNTATTAGGGIYNGYEFTMQVMGSRILYNSAPNGGGVFSWNELVGATSVKGSCIAGNSYISFFNDKAAKQTATGNWWGTAGGPGAPGADTVGGSVDTSGFLYTPILGCTLRIYLPLVLR